MQGDLFGVYFRGTRSETHTQFSLPPSKCIYQSLTPTHTHREAVYRHLIRRDLHLQALADGVKVSRLPNVIFHVENIIIPARNLNTGGQPGAIFNSLLGNAEKGRSEPLKKEKVAPTKKKNSVGFQSASQLRTCCRADLTAPFPPHILGTRSGTILNRTPAGADTMSEPASSNYTMQMPSRPFNAASGVSPQLVCRLSPGAHTHLWRPEEEGWGVICSFIHLEILLLLRFWLDFPFYWFPFIPLRHIQ